MIWWLRLLGWASVLTAASWMAGDAYHHLLGIWVTAAYVTFGWSCDLSKIELLAPLDLGLFLALCLAERMSWSARLRSCALGIPILVALDLLTGIAGVALVMARASGAPSAAAGRVFESFAAVLPWTGALATRWLLLGPPLLRTAAHPRRGPRAGNATHVLHASTGGGRKKRLTMRNRHFRSVLAILLAVSGSSWTSPGVVHAQATGEQLLEAARTAIQTGERTEFDTLAQGALIAALAYVNVKVYVLRRDIATAIAASDIDATAGAIQYERLTEIQNRLEVAKNGRCEHHDDCGDEPFFGRFTSSVPLTPPLPSSFSLTLDPGTGTSYFRNPSIWDGTDSHPTVLTASMNVSLNQGTGQFVLTSFDNTLGSFPINGLPSGTNTVAMRPGAPPGAFTFTTPVSSQMLEFEAHYEGIVSNAIYPPSNPMVYLADVQGYVDTQQSKVWVCSSEPMIVPGAPGHPPLETMKIAIGARASFDATTNLLRIGENTHLDSLPDVTLVRDGLGNYVSVVGPGEPLVGARLEFAPLQFTGTGPESTYHFANALFAIRTGSTTYLTGTMTNIRLDAHTCSYMADLMLDPGPPSGSPAIDRFRGLVNHMVMLTGPVAAEDLVSGTNGFTQTWASGSFWLSFLAEEPPPVAAPATTIWGLLLGAGALAALAIRTRRSREMT